MTKTTFALFDVVYMIWLAEWICFHKPVAVTACGATLCCCYRRCRVPKEWGDITDHIYKIMCYKNMFYNLHCQ